MTCTACPLNGCAKVPGHGPDHARLVLVGEAPGDEEARRGKPFVGPAGQLLDKVLEECGVDRAEVYVTNAVLCRPHRKPTAKEIKLCRNRLLGEVLSRTPTVVVTLGDAAVRALLPDKTGPLRERRGVPEQPEALRGVWVVPTYHPAALLHGAAALWFDLVKDMIRAVELLSRPAPARVDLEALKYTVVDTPQGLTQLLRRLRAGPIAQVVDVETASRGELLCLGLACSPDEAFVVTDAVLCRRGAIPRLDKVLGTKTLIGHNLKFDLQVLWRRGFSSVRTGWDTMLAHYLLDERRGTHGLKHLAREYLGVPEYDATTAPYTKRMEECPRDALYRYNAADAACTYALATLFDRQLTDDGHGVLTELLLPASDILARMEMLGTCVDIAALQELERAVTEQIDALLPRLFAAAGREFNPNSPKQLGTILYDELGLPVPMGKLSTNEDALKMLEGYHPLPQLILEYRGLAKFLGTYVQGLLAAADGDGRVHTTFNLHGTVTGRLSSSNPINLQNIPKEKDEHGLRRVFVATPGWTLARGDLSQAEIRVLAFYSRCRVLLAALKAGEDIHRKTASGVYRCPPEAVTDDQRHRAKRATFGILYGISDQGLAREMRIPIEEAAELIRGVFKTYPGVSTWVRRVQQQALATGELRTPTGRVRRFGLVTPKSKGEIMRQAVNTPIQSLASDICLMALIAFGQRLHAEGNEDTRLLLTVHDEILLETREDPGVVAQRLRWTMLQAAARLVDVPFEVEVSVGDNWHDMKQVQCGRAA